jgi:hypothetical protein
MSVVLPRPEHFHNGVAHSILGSCSKDVSEERKIEIRAAYRILLDRATIIRVHTSGWIAQMQWATPEDAAFADALENEMFIRGSVPSCDIERALRAIFAED